MWNTVKSVSASYLSHLSGYLVSAATIVSAINPKLLPPQYAFITAMAGMVVTGAHHGYTIGNASGVLQAAAKAAFDAASNAVQNPVVKLLLVGIFGLGPVGLTGCAALTGTQAAQVNSGVTVAVDVAAGFAIQQKSNNPDVWKSRAVEFKGIALQLQNVNNAGMATLATLAADLEPLIAKLPAADQLAANAAVAALTPYLNAQLQANPKAGAVQAEIAVVLSAFINACEAYGG